MSVRTFGIGIDPGTVGGLVILSSIGKDLGYKCHLSCDFFDKKCNGLQRIQSLGHMVTNHVKEIVPTDQPSLVVMEGFAFGSKTQLVTMAEVSTSIKLRLTDEGYTGASFQPTSLKKFVTGSGKAQKDKMMLEVYKQFGFEAPSSHQADAYALAVVSLCSQFAKNSLTNLHPW